MEGYDVNWFVECFFEDMEFSLLIKEVVLCVVGIMLKVLR